MSFDIFVQYFADGQQATVPLDAVLQKFSPYAEEESEDSWKVVYDEQNECSLFLGEVDDNRNVDGFCINRPCADERLWKSIHDCLAVGNGVLFWPGLEGLIATADVTEHIPEEMSESLGAVIVVSDYHEILQMLNAR
ncbi:MAG: hypothetical protein LLF76_12410 [Planctomycetaceae bacterium]|nr:hypothetical protein [Planctomycetaceae bacterium]